MTKLVFLCFAFVGFVAASDLMFKDIADSLAQAQARQGQGDFFAVQKACYPELGCFTTDGPMKQTGILPFAPEKIGTTFYAYNPEEHVVDPHKPATFKVINAHKRIVIAIHGFSNTHHTALMVSLKDSLMKHTNGEVGTVILVDWAKGAVAPDYVDASTNTQVVGRQVAFFVNELKKHHGVDLKNVYLIGFSLGAQVAGFAGKFSQSEYHWKFSRITGLDAAAPMFENHEGSHLIKTDADFVDGIHTSAGNNLLVGEVGFIKPYGHLDFFPNSGHHQPNCHSLLHPVCNHQSSILFYVSSLTTGACKFSAYPCADWATFQAHTCTKSDVEMGYHADKTPHATGIRFLTTVKDAPYCHK